MDTETTVITTKFVRSHRYLHCALWSNLVDDFEHFVSDMGYAIDDDEELQSTFDSIDTGRSGGIDFEHFREWCSPDNMCVAVRIFSFL